MKVVEYMLVFGITSTILTNSVNLEIKCGWQPFGSVTMYTTANGTGYVQTMVKYANN